MSKQSNPTMIGAFVIGAVVLLVVGVLVFGGSELLVEKQRAVAYFPGSVKGLRTGASVTFRGVRVGYVSDIQIQTDVDTLESQIQVELELLSGSLVFTEKGRVLDKDRQTQQVKNLNMQEIVDAGLRAQLNAESFVTGQLLVDLDFHPETPPLYRTENPPYTEIPTIPSDIQEVLDRVQRFMADIQESVDIGELAEDVESILDGVDELVNSPDIRESLAGLNRIINDTDTQELTGSLQAAITDARGVLQDTRSLVTNADAGITPLLDELMPAIKKLDDALSAGEAALANVSEQMQGDTELVYTLTTTLDELQGAARSLRIFLDYIERNPEALIRGK
ncbi:MAG: MlaD family protein [Gammaproteobacteria bacterium]|nr:MlaD family protein [Gammaproteobacteria bacterium]